MSTPLVLEDAYHFPALAVSSQGRQKNPVPAKTVPYREGVSVRRARQAASCDAFRKTAIVGGHFCYRDPKQIALKLFANTLKLPLLKIAQHIKTLCRPHLGA